MLVFTRNASMIHYIGQAIVLAENEEIKMQKFTVGKRKIEIAVEMLSTGTSVGYKIGHLSSEQKRALGYAQSTNLAIRQDGEKSELVKVTDNGFTGWLADAELTQ